MAKFYAPTKLSENIRETPEGFLLCLNVPIARTGWMEYGEGETPLEVGDDGIVRVWRSEEEVFRPETVASFEGKTVTVKHPRDFVTPENWSYLAKGSVQNVRQSNEKDDDGEWSLLADILVTDDFTIQLVKAGLREVSCGYEAEYEQTSEGEGIQTNIVGNHVALVEQGRAGSSYAINDEKGKGIMTPKMLENLKKKFGAKAVDEAMKEEEKSKDEKGSSYDELVKSVKDLMSRVEGFMEQGKAKDDDGEEKEEKSKDEDKEAPKKEEKESEDAGEEDMKMEERLKACEAAVAKILEKMGSKDEDKKDDKKSEDDDSDEGMAGDESEDADEDKEDAKKKKVGDSKQKGTGLEKSKDAKAFDGVDFGNKNEPMTPEKMNELNAAAWARK